MARAPVSSTRRANPQIGNLSIAALSCKGKRERIQGQGLSDSQPCSDSGHEGFVANSEKGREESRRSVARLGSEQFKLLGE